ncbi:hypothetical protein C2845_PM12G03970 [Panicum miliaceum]|uniref:Uncharacterized protein n=1 Tax=Panicum miliaceum TaxID=4540 RepID=A0A3L6QG33_PANMI|nr:hypothetical protein C2845_PM12G03970 [Panicum miliaceum]
MPWFYLSSWQKRMNTAIPVAVGIAHCSSATCSVGLVAVPMTWYAYPKVSDMVRSQADALSLFLPVELGGAAWNSLRHTTRLAMLTNMKATTEMAATSPPPPPPTAGTPPCRCCGTGRGSQRIIRATRGYRDRDRPLEDDAGLDEGCCRRWGKAADPDPRHAGRRPLPPGTGDGRWSWGFADPNSPPERRRRGGLAESDFVRAAAAGVGGHGMSRTLNGRDAGVGRRLLNRTLVRAGRRRHHTGLPELGLNS